MFAKVEVNKLQVDVKIACSVVDEVSRKLDAQKGLTEFARVIAIRDTALHLGWYPQELLAYQDYLHAAYPVK